MTTPIVKKHLGNLDPFDGSDFTGGVFHFRKDDVDYKFPMETFLSLFATIGNTVGDNSRLRASPLPIKPKPVLDVPPTTTLTKGTGISAVSIVSGGSGYAVGNGLTVMGGTSAFPGTLRVNAVDGNGTITAISVSGPGIYTATPNNPCGVTGGSGSGATVNLTWNAGVATSISSGKTWNRGDSVFRYWGYSIQDTAPGYRGNGVGNGTQCIIEFDSDTPILDFRFVGGNAYYDLYVDGQRVANVSPHTDSSGAPYYYTVNWNGSAVTRHYRLVGINTGFGGVVTPSAYAIWQSPETRRPKVWQLGDSYTYGTMATQGSFNDFRIICDALALDGIADGIGGSGWSSTGSTQPQQRIRSKLSTITYLPDIVFLSLGYNDAAAGRLDVVDTNFRESVALIRQLAPKAKIFVIGPATPIGTTTQLNNIRDTIMTACTDLNLPFVDVRDWVNSSNKGLYTATDNVHPTDAGYWYRGARIAQALSPLIG